MDIAGGNNFDVIVVGAGNAATCAALSACEAGARVLMLEIAPEETRGGNPCFNGGAFREGIRVLYETPAIGLLQGDSGVEGVRVRHQGRIRELRARAVVLACGGFEANAEMRARYLGPNWDLAKVRGSRFNTGQGLKMALDFGAAVAGHWSGAHAVAWDLNAPPFGDLDVGDRFQKHNYPFGIVVNARGERFLDEGLDFHSYTYAKYGGEILNQPGLFAWQIFDQKVVHLLREEYRIPRITKEKADTFEALAERR